MGHFDELLSKIKNRFDGDQKESFVAVEVIAKRTGVKLSITSVKIAKGTLRIKAAPTVLFAIRLKEKEILEDLATSGVHVSVIG